jgi:light-regulated signal transduction histidine kinase (bacteriophytochrome)
VTGFTHLLEADIAAGELAELPGHAARIAATAARMNALIDGLLAVSRVTHSTLASVSVDLAALVSEVVREAAAAPSVGIEVGALPVVTGDVVALRQVWTNLIDNALKYSARRERPSIAISCETAGAEHVFHVRDNGAGFDPAYAGKLFGVFQRLHTVKEFEGTGVGLAVVRRVVERHGGRVWAEGKVDGGATFHFTLPVDPAG